MCQALILLRTSTNYTFDKNYRYLLHDERWQLLLFFILLCLVLQIYNYISNYTFSS